MGKVFFEKLEVNWSFLFLRMRIRGEVCSAKVGGWGLFFGGLSVEFGVVGSKINF